MNIPTFYSAFVYSSLLESYSAIGFFPNIVFNSVIKQEPEREKFVSYLQWRTEPELQQWKPFLGSDSVCPHRDVLRAHFSTCRTESCAGCQRWWSRTVEIWIWTSAPQREEPNPCLLKHSHPERFRAGSVQVSVDHLHLYQPVAPALSN